MPTCPKGHTSTAADYCDECGTPIGGAGEAGATPSAVAPAAPAAAESGERQRCPKCDTPRSGRFCEADGYDFVAADLGGAPAEPVSSTESAQSTVEDNAVPADESAPDEKTPAGPAWRVAVSADSEYHARVQAMGGPDADAMVYPQFFPERLFALSGKQVLIGRHSRSRGIDPQVDLTGPPEDPGVSHSHALLVRGADGSWSVVDLDSANGTYLNDSPQPLTPNTPVTLQAGDRVHVGAWTTLTISTA